MKKYMFIFLVLSTMYTHVCNSMESVPNPLIKEIVLWSIILCSNHEEARQAMLSTSLVCKQWRDIIHGQKEYESIITALAQREQINPACIAALMGTQQAATWLAAHLKTVKANFTKTEDIDMFLIDFRKVLSIKTVFLCVDHDEFE